MEKLDEGIKTLLELGKRRGFLTFDQVNDLLPAEASNPEQLQALVEIFEELGIELIGEEEAETRLLGGEDDDADSDDEIIDEPSDDDDDFGPEELEDEISRRIDDPVRMYLTQMGEIP